MMAKAPTLAELEAQKEALDKALDAITLPLVSEFLKASETDLFLRKARGVYEGLPAGQVKTQVGNIVSVVESVVSFLIHEEKRLS